MEKANTGQDAEITGKNWAQRASQQVQVRTLYTTNGCLEECFSWGTIENVGLSKGQTRAKAEETAIDVGLN